LENKVLDIVDARRNHEKYSYNLHVKLRSQNITTFVIWVYTMQEELPRIQD